MQPRPIHCIAPTCQRLRNLCRSDGTVTASLSVQATAANVLLLRSACAYHRASGAALDQEVLTEVAHILAQLMAVWKYDFASLSRYCYHVTVSGPTALDGVAEEVD